MADSFPRRGEIWRLFTPGRPEDPHQPRRGLIVSDNERNRRRSHVLAVPIYSQGSIGPTHVQLPGQLAGLDHDSIAFCEEVSTISLRFLVSRLGPPVPSRYLYLVGLGVRRALGEIVRPANLPAHWPQDEV